mmetsp:Transcript_30530/g.62301  ORF Transcript_30530/g.62301 Transcript_30530/m.62301 type:complete len:257 (-) Transcript_30530:941-1711(-)
MSAASNSLRQYLVPIMLTLPPILFVRDNFYSLYRVKGSSMEPALKHGDVLLVRKADFYPRRQWAQWAASPSSNFDSYNQQCDKYHDHENALRAIALDAQSQRPIGDSITGYTFLNPPTIYQLGSVVVFRAPDAEKYPSSEYRVKRVIGLGGQIVGPVDSFHRIVRIPPFGLWVEGCNREAGDSGRVDNYVASSEIEKENSFYRNSDMTSSIDSRNYGPVSKNLVIGVAERVVWPPSRCGTIERITSQRLTSWWPDF